MSTTIKSLKEVLQTNESGPSPEWDLKVIVSEQCVSYVAWNTHTREALVVDPKEEDYSAYQSVANELMGFRWIGVFDTHTHADHVSCAARLANSLQTSLVMHSAAPSKRVHLRVSADTTLSSAAAPVKILLTPGHTPDSFTLFWGPFLFGGDTLLYGDVGRDDLPGGDAQAHYESLEKIKREARSDQLILPGHDPKGGRVSSWTTQLKANSSLLQSRADFISEAAAFDAPAPTLLKRSLKENFK